MVEKSRNSFRQEIDQKLTAVDSASGSGGNPAGVAFARDFLSYYAVDNAFGKAGKRNADAFLVHLMVKYGIIDMSTPDKVYEAAINLQVRDSYLKSLYYDAQMMFGDAIDPRARCKSLVSLLFVNGTRKSALEDRKLIVSVDDQLLRNYVKAIASANFDWSDSSFKSSIIKMPIEAFIRVVERAYCGVVSSEVQASDNESKIKDEARAMMIADMRSVLEDRAVASDVAPDIAKEVLAKFGEADDANVSKVFEELIARYEVEDAPQESKYRKVSSAISDAANAVAVGEAAQSVFGAICSLVPLIVGVL